jgi:hypothetical protein
MKNAFLAFFKVVAIGQNFPREDKNRKKETLRNFTWTLSIESIVCARKFDSRLTKTSAYIKS